MPKEFPEHGIVAGITKFGVDWVFDEVEESWKEGIAESFGWLFSSFGYFVKKSKNFVSGYGYYFYVFDMDNEIV